MNNRQQRQTENASAEIFKYDADNGVSEYHVMIHARCPEDTYEQQLNAVVNAYFALLEGEIRGAVAVFKRYFLSDAANQSDMLLALTTESSDCALSIVEQPPLNGTKIALWVYLQSGVQTRVLHNGLFEVRHGAYRHLWSGNAFNRAANSEYQTRLLLNDYVMQLMEQGCKLADNCIRTWFFVQNVDVNYAGVVKAVHHTEPDGEDALHFEHRYWRTPCRPESVGADGHVCRRRDKVRTGSFSVCARVSESHL